MLLASLCTLSLMGLACASPVGTAVVPPPQGPVPTAPTAADFKALAASGQNPTPLNKLAAPTTGTKVPSSSSTSVWDQITSNPRFSLFVQYVEGIQPRMKDVLSEASDDRFTLFVPSNEAFEKLPEEWSTYAARKSSTAFQFAQAVALYHLHPNAARIAESFKEEEVIDSALEPYDIAISKENGTVFINEAEVILPNQMGQRSIWHGINRIISPLFFMNTAIYDIQPSAIDEAATIALEVAKLPPAELNKLISSLGKDIFPDGIPQIPGAPVDVPQVPSTFPPPTKQTVMQSPPTGPKSPEIAAPAVNLNAVAPVAAR